MATPFAFRVLYRHSSSSSRHTRVISAFTSRENYGPESEIGDRWRQLAEIVSLSDRLTQYGSLVLMCHYTEPVYLVPFASFRGVNGLRDFDRKWFKSLGGVADRKGVARN
jgi:hypothetical protein